MRTYRSFLRASGLHRSGQLVALGLLFLACLLPVACGRKGRMPPLVMKPANPLPDPLEKVADPPVRVLLKDGFRSLVIEGGALAPNLTVRSSKDLVEALETKSGRVLKSGSGFRILPASGRLLSLEDRTVRGVLDVFINPVGSPIIVNEVGLEDYLKGVITNELSPILFPELEALRAQAIAARTYAISRRGANARLGFDIYTDHRSQMYAGVQSEHPLSSRAVVQTRGLIASFQDKPILALYSSTCGGVTAGYQSIFQRPAIPYLSGGASCPDQSSRYHLWEETVRISNVQSQIDRLSGVGRLRSLEVVERDQTGRVVSMWFDGTEGRKLLKGSKVRFALGLRSNWILDLTQVKDGDGYLVELGVKGRGWGHGVGLCQIGSVALAKEGLDFEDILKHYYKGIDVARSY